MTESERSAGELPFSAASRAAQWASLGGRTFDLLVVGGGITGVGTAREAAGRGLDVALVERGDFAEGTSSRSSRLIHGGLRYLEALDFGLVFEALGERRRLLELAPHLVRPLRFLFPVYRGAGPGMMMLAAGMWLYDALSLFSGVRNHRMLSRGGVLGREPGLSRGGLRGGALYSDAQVDDARLTLAVAQAAHETGATLVSRAAVTDFLHGPDGRIAGAVVEDTLGGARTEVRARLVLSATGPWTDEIRCLANPAAPPRLRPTKGVHIELPPGRLGNRGAIIFRSPVDGRVMFVLPWRDATYVGTTDTDFAGPPGEVAAGVGDVEYLIRSANALFPSARLTSADVVGTWAGVRPLLAPGSNVSAGQTSREHEIWREPGGLLCIAGGKLTTFRVMAVEAAERAASILRREHGVESGAFYSEHLPLPGAPADWEALRARIGREARALGITDASAEHLARAHGTAAEEILQRIRARPEIGAQILPPHPYLQAEVEHAVRREMAMTLDDVLRRRTRLFDEAADGGMTVAEEVALRMARTPELQWTPEQVAAQVAAYGERVQRARAALH